MSLRSSVWPLVVPLVAVLTCVPAAAQVAPAATATTETAKDPLGRSTPRGTVLGFLTAARKGDFATAAEYLQTQKGDDRAEIARQLFVVLDTRLPPRLHELSDRPEGSLPNPLKPAQDVVGTIASASGPVDVLLTRLDSPRGAPPVWLFSRTTLEQVPDLYDEVSVVAVEAVLPSWLVNTRVGGIRLYGWLAALVGIPLLYGAITLLARLLGALVRLVVRRAAWRDLLSQAVPSAPLKLLLLALMIKWVLSEVGLGLLARQFWSGVAAMMTVSAVAWLLILLTALGERLVQRRLPRYAAGGSASLLRLTRRVADLLILVAAALVVLGYFGVDATAALAGLGVGGIAVALAAQKTLENVIAGISLIADQAVRIGDAIKVGDVVGSVESVGLRSTTIRTLDRTIVSIPNGQVATVNVENLSARDKFWFHPFITLRAGTPADVVGAVVDAIEQLLAEYPLVDRESVRVRFLRIGPYSFDIEVFAYVFARDWNRFLEIQEELLFAALEAVRTAGAELAYPTQSIHMTDDRPPVDVSGGPAARAYPARRRVRQAT